MIHRHTQTQTHIGMQHIHTYTLHYAMLYYTKLYCTHMMVLMPAICCAICSRQPSSRARLVAATASCDHSDPSLQHK